MVARSKFNYLIHYFGHTNAMPRVTALVFIWTSVHFRIFGRGNFSFSLVKFSFDFGCGKFVIILFYLSAQLFTKKIKFLQYQKLQNTWYLFDGCIWYTGWRRPAFGPRTHDRPVHLPQKYLWNGTRLGTSTL